MEIAVWILVALIGWIGLTVSQELRAIKKELETVRQYLQTNSLYPGASIPQKTLETLELLGGKLLIAIGKRAGSRE